MHAGIFDSPVRVHTYCTMQRMEMGLNQSIATLDQRTYASFQVPSSPLASKATVPRLSRSMCVGMPVSPVGSDIGCAVVCCGGERTTFAQLEAFALRRRDYEPLQSRF